jgi:hypothetical protein
MIFRKYDYIQEKFNLFYPQSISIQRRMLENCARFLAGEIFPSNEPVI